MLPTKSLSTLFASFNTPEVSEVSIFKCHNDDEEYSIISKWNQIDILRKDTITYTRTHLIKVPRSNHEKLQVKYASQLHFSSFGKGYPSSVQQNNVHTVWDIQTPDGCHRAVCIQPVSSSSSSPPPPSPRQVTSNSSKFITAGCEEASTVVQIWINGRLSNIVKLPTTPPNALHGRVYPTEGGSFHGAAWSKARDKIVYLAEEVAPGDSSESCGGDSSFAFQEDWGEGNEGVHKPIICVLDITTKTVTLAPLKENNLNLASNEPIWTPDDVGILFIGYPLKAYNLGIKYCVQRVCRLYFWNMKNDTIKPISDAGRSVHSPRFSPNGEYLVWLENPVGGPHGQCYALMGMIWSLEDFQPKIIIPILKNTLDLIDFKYSGLYCTLSERCWSSDSRRIVISSYHNGFHDVGYIVSVAESIAQSKPVILKLPKLYLADEACKPSSLSILDFYEDILVCCTSSPIHPHHLAVLNLKNLDDRNTSVDLRQHQWLILSDGMDLKQSSVRSVKGIDCVMRGVLHINENGTFSSCYYLLIHPRLEKDGSIKQIDISDFNFNEDISDLIANRLQGLIVMPHGGPHSVSRLTWSSMITSFCICGFACLLINYTGSLGYGDEFIQDLIGRIGERDVSDCVEATKVTLKYLQRYESNLKAVLFGGSHGGFLSLHLAGRYNHLFSAVVTRNPVTSLISMIHTSDIPDWCFTQAGLTDPGEWPLDHLLPTTNELTRLADVSPMKYLDDTWSVPLLMLLGGKDRRVPNSQGLTFCRKLKASCPNIPCEIRLYPQDSHALDSPACSLDVFVTTVNWFLKHLKERQTNRQ
ncbi:unnamed protein product [Trichobilharzia szidati]|nr:unnamed protein product [Trichobilharzia szidati]